MTVQEFFEAEKIFKSDVVAMQDESEYWEKAGNFVLENWDEEVNSLTQKQANWLDRILEDLVEKRLKR